MNLARHTHKKFLFIGIVLGLLLCFLMAAFAKNADAQTIPRACGQYQRQLTREVNARLGPAASVTPFAAQIMQESSCQASARSGVGALGLAEFMPETADWIGSLDGALAPAQPMNPYWAIRAMVLYDSYLMERNKGETECDTIAFALAAYNGGEGWLRRDQSYAYRLGYNKKVWFNAVEVAPDPHRSKAAIKENHEYPRRIMVELAPIFVAAGWGRIVTCQLENER